MSLKVIDLGNNNEIDEIVPIVKENKVYGNENRYKIIDQGIVGYYDNYEQAFWTEDSRSIIYSTDLAGEDCIMKVNIDNKNVSRLSHLDNESATY